MSEHESDTLFAGSIPKLYEMYFVPFAFKPYAADLVRRLGPGPFTNVLEVAAGTGVVTRELAASLPGRVAIVATDLNEAMIEHAKSIQMCRPVEWRQADAMALSFGNESFDAVICQFGVMFFADKVKAFSEIYRVLRPGGIFVFNLWDRIEENEFPDTVTHALAKLFPHDPPRFHARVPHGYCSQSQIEKDLAAGGFTASPQIEIVTKESHAHTARQVAMAYCQGTPLRNEIEERDALLLSDATTLAAKALVEKFGTSDIKAKSQALAVTVRK
jgi:SAM-dependent methyltransferase